MDVNGNDNSPEWGWCKHEGCKDEAFPIWLSGEFPDDPDLLLCPTHIGTLIAALREGLEGIAGIGAGLSDEALKRYANPGHVTFARRVARTALAKLTDEYHAPSIPTGAG